MKIFNLTDVETPALKERGLSNQPIIVHRWVINPGEGCEVQDSDQVRRALRGYVKDGMASVNVLPPSYVVKKEQKKRG